MNTTLARTLVAALPLACGLASCGGGGGDDERAVAPAAALAVPDVDAGPPAEGVATDVLLRNAERHARDGLEVNLAATAALLADLDARAAGPALQALGVGPAVLASLERDAGEAGAFVAGLLDAPEDVPGTFADDIDGDDDDAAAMSTGLSRGFDAFVAHTLGEVGRSSALREGNRIVIDPDEGALCEAWYSEWYHGETERANCRTLGAGLSVTVDAVAESAGIVTWSFDELAVLRSAYAPGSVDYELRLAGLAGYLRAAAALDGEADSVPATLEGTLRLSTEILDTAPGSEAGRFSFGVGEPLRVVDAGRGTRVELAPSTLFSLAADAATGDADVRMSIGAFDASFGVDHGDGWTTSFGLSHGGVVMDATLDGASESVNVSRYGLPGAPLTWSIDGTEFSRVSLPVTSARIGGGGDALTLTSRAELGLELIGDPRTGEGLTLGFAAPAGTELVERASGDLEVRAGGPVTATLEVVRSDGGVERSESSVPAGQCIGGEAEPAAGELLVARPCD